MGCSARPLHPCLLDRGSCLFRREKVDEAFGCLGILSTFHHSGGEYELKIGGDRAHEIDAMNGQDFTYREDDHLHSSAGDLGRSRI